MTPLPDGHHTRLAAYADRVRRGVHLWDRDDERPLEGDDADEMQAYRVRDCHRLMELEKRREANG